MSAVQMPLLFSAVDLLPSNKSLLEPNTVPNDWSDSWADVNYANLHSVLSKLNLSDTSKAFDTQVQKAPGQAGYESPPALDDVCSDHSRNSGNSSIGNSFCSTSVGNASRSNDRDSATSRSNSQNGSDDRQPEPKELYVSNVKQNKKKKKHPNAGSVNSYAALQKGGKAVDHEKYKTRMCCNWQQTGKCPYGEACVYAHGAKEMRGEQENQAVVTSLSKLADQLTKKMNGHPSAKSSGFTRPLGPLRYKKPKTPNPKPVMHEQPAPNNGNVYYMQPNVNMQPSLGNSANMNYVVDHNTQVYQHMWQLSPQ